MKDKKIKCTQTNVYIHILMKISHGYFQKLFEKSKFLISDFYYPIQQDI